MKSSKFTKHEHLIFGVVTVNNKGQVVIPADARSITNIQSRDKLLVMVHPGHDGIVLIKPDGLESSVKKMLERIIEAKNSPEKNQ